MTTIVVAAARGGAIGRDGDLPWHLPEDLAHFRRMTMDHTLVMGRRTWASIGRPLPGRRMIVVSSRELDLPDTVVRAPDPTSALDLALTEDEDPSIVGGATIYAALLDRVDRIELTRIDRDVPDADTFFEVPDGEFVEVGSRAGEDPTVTYVTLARR
ncbi:MAG: dihydrofolate reductase [Actinomycetota bacterium]|nr:dihydrofolate reductase [Actinomycetota bacterium]